MSKQIDARKIWLVAAERTNPNIPASLTGANAYKTRGIDYKAYDGDKKEKQYDGDSGQDVPVKIENAFNSFNFKIDLAPSGTAGEVPFADLFLRVCGMVASIDEAAGTVTYAPATTPDQIAMLDACVSHLADDDVDYVIKSERMRGQLGITIKAGEDPEADVQLQGDYIRPVTAAHAAPVFGLQDTQMAIPANAQNTPIFKINNKGICVEDFSIKNLSGYTPSRRNMPGGCKYTAMKKGIVEADITFMEPDWANEFNPYELAETDDGVKRVPFILQHGTVAGKKFSIECPEVQFIQPEKAEIDGDVGRKATIRFLKPLALIWM